MHNFLLSSEHVQYVRVEIVNIITLSVENCMFRKPLVKFPLRVRKVNFRDEVFNSVTITSARRKSD